MTRGTPGSHRDGPGRSVDFLPRTVGTFGGLPSGGSEESACNVGDPGLIPGSGSSPEEGNGYPLQYACLENSTNRGAWRAI